MTRSRFDLLSEFKFSRVHHQLEEIGYGGVTETKRRI